MPSAPEWIERELKLVDDTLELEWDDRYEAFILQSRKGDSPSRMQIVPYGMFGYEDLNNTLVQAVRKGIRQRDQGVSIGEIQAEKKAAADAREEARSEFFREGCRAQATREVEAMNASAEVHALGSKTSKLGNRIDAVRG